MKPFIEKKEDASRVFIEIAWSMDRMSGIKVEEAALCLRVVRMQSDGKERIK